jgi:hypothetical protein
VNDVTKKSSSEIKEGETKKPVVPTNTQQPKMSQIQNNKFDLKTAKPGEIYGSMTVSNVKMEESFRAVYFSGETTISGTYSSDWAGMVGEYITLKLDDISKEKMPVLSNNDYDIVLDPLNPKNSDVIEKFGKTGTKGKFQLVIDEFVVTDYVESFSRTASINKLIQVEKT